MALPVAPYAKTFPTPNSKLEMCFFGVNIFKLFLPCGCEVVDPNEAPNLGVNGNKEPSYLNRGFLRLSGD